MVAFGYTVMGEQAGPKQLVADAQRAEAAGFDYIAARATRRTPGRCWERLPTPPSASNS